MYLLLICSLLEFEKKVPTSIPDRIIRMLQFFYTAVYNICIILSIRLFLFYRIDVYQLIIRLILVYWNCVCIMCFRAPNLYNNKGVDIRIYCGIIVNIYLIYLTEESEDTKVAITFRKSKDSQQNYQKKMDKWTHHYAKD